MSVNRSFIIDFKNSSEKLSSSLSKKNLTGRLISLIDYRRVIITFEGVIIRLFVLVIRNPLKYHPYYILCYGRRKEMKKNKLAILTCLFFFFYLALFYHTWYNNMVMFCSISSTLFVENFPNGQSNPWFV